MAERRSLVGRAVRLAARVVWTGLASAGEHDNHPRRRRDDPPPSPARTLRRDVDDPRHHRLF